MCTARQLKFYLMEKEFDRFGWQLVTGAVYSQKDLPKKCFIHDNYYSKLWIYSPKKGSKIIFIMRYREYIDAVKKITKSWSFKLIMIPTHDVKIIIERNVASLIHMPKFRLSSSFPHLMTNKIVYDEEQITQIMTSGKDLTTTQIGDIINKLMRLAIFTGRGKLNWIEASDLSDCLVHTLNNEYLWDQLGIENLYSLAHRLHNVPDKDLRDVEFNFEKIDIGQPTNKKRRVQLGI